VQGTVLLKLEVKGSTSRNQLSTEQGGLPAAATYDRSRFQLPHSKHCIFDFATARVQVQQHCGVLGIIWSQSHSIKLVSIFVCGETAVIGNSPTEYSVPKRPRKLNESRITL
jgi:hypothetical protein